MKSIYLIGGLVAVGILGFLAIYPANDPYLQQLYCGIKELGSGTDITVNY